MRKLGLLVFVVVLLFVATEFWDLIYFVLLSLQGRS